MDCRKKAKKYKCHELASDSSKTKCSRVHATKAAIDDASAVVLLHDALQRQICKNRHRILFIEFNCVCNRGRRCGGRCRRARIGDIACLTRRAMIKTFATHWLPMKHMRKHWLRLHADAHTCGGGVAVSSNTPSSNILPIGFSRASTIAFSAAASNCECSASTL